MNNMTFVDLQNHMNLKKQTGSQVKYTYRSAEQILQMFKTLSSGWKIALNDDIIEIGYGARVIKAKVLNIRETTKKAEASELYELVD